MLNIFGNKITNSTFYVLSRLQELSSSNEENPDLSDIELIQHINVDTIRLIKLLNGMNSNIDLSQRTYLKIFLVFYAETISKSKLLRKSVHLVLIASLEKAIWNWMDTYPHEFTEIQVCSIVLHQLFYGIYGCIRFAVPLEMSQCRFIKVL